jgi:16S rRNA (uracil1498-N3)-methyltransferase
MGRRWRIHLDEAGIAPGRRLDLPRAEAHHVFRVLRLRAGQRVSLFDGAGGEWWATVTRSAAEGVSVEVGPPILEPVESPLELELFQGWCEPSRMEWVLQKGTEIGVAAMHPVATEPGRPLSAKRLQRWRRIVVEAAKQCGRRRLPAVDPVDHFPDPDGATLALLLDAGPGAEPLSRRLAGPAPARVWLAVGPAGGLSDEGKSGMSAAGWRRTGLGPRVLRAETAGLAAAAVVLHRWGDLGRDGSER